MLQVRRLSAVLHFLLWNTFRETDALSLSPRGLNQSPSRLSMILSHDWSQPKKKIQVADDSSDTLFRAKVVVLEDVVRQIRAERDELRVKVLAEEGARRRAEAEQLEQEQQWEAEKASLKQQQDDKTSLHEEQERSLRQELKQKQDDLKTQMEDKQRQFLQQTQKAHDNEKRVLEEKIKALESSLEQSASELSEQQELSGVTLKDAMQTQLQQHESALQQAVAEQQAQHEEALAQQQAQLLAQWQGEKEEATQIASAAVLAAEGREQSVKNQLQSLQTALLDQKKLLEEVTAEKRALKQQIQQKAQLLQLQEQQRRDEQAKDKAETETLQTNMLELEKEIALLRPSDDMGKPSEDTKPQRRGFWRRVGRFFRRRKNSG